MVGGVKQDFVQAPSIKEFRHILCTAQNAPFLRAEGFRIRRLSS
jgi:hypothetical protein